MAFQLDTSKQVYSPDPSLQIGSGVQTITGAYLIFIIFCIELCQVIKGLSSTKHRSFIHFLALVIRYWTVYVGGG